MPKAVTTPVPTTMETTSRQAKAVGQRTISTASREKAGETKKDGLKLTSKDKFKKRLGFTHKWQKNPNTPWKYLKVKSEETTVNGRTVLTFTDEGSAYRSYYEEDVVQL